MTRDRYLRQASDIEGEVGRMADHARDMLIDGVRALKDLDKTLAENVVTREPQLAHFDEQIETSILTFLTLQGPVASDLRRLGASLKMITYLNRIGRYGYDIARVARGWPDGQAHVARLVGIADMAAKVQQMLDSVLKAFREGLAADTKEIEALETDVDAMRHAVFREALTYMMQDPHNIEVCAHYMMVARYLERCGDNVCKMAEKIHYAVTGKRLLIG